jgi:ubiquitin carboxyl-terminal hydrolase 7
LAAVPRTEEAHTEVASTAESQPVEDLPTSRFTWTIENFTRFNGKKQYSEVFVVGGFKW